ncbi:MAG: hypothetical protein MJ120_05080 [Clostridia bacterium]|nr:hypothetical protein [Clostridia bacterium]
MAFNAFVYSYSPITTFTIAERAQYEDTFEFDGFVIRDEEPVQNKTTGTAVPLVRDGERVAKGDPIAVVCKSEEDASAYKQLQNAQAELERYKNLNNTNGTQDLDAEKLNSEISDAYTLLMDCSTSGNFDGLDEAVNLFNEKNAIRQILADGSINVSKQMTAIDKEIKKLQSKKINTTSVSAPASGYYINTVDGYEKSVSYENATSLNANQIREILKMKPEAKKEGSFGKLVSSYRWYIVGIVGKEHATDFPAEGKVNVNFPDSGIKNVEMQVVSIKNQGDSVAVILSSDLMNETYANMRNETVQIVTSSGDGFKIPANLVRFNNKNESGIYVLRGKIISFISADILYSDGESVIVDSESAKGNGIALYDEVITKGKDIRDGKVIR